MGLDFPLMFLEKIRILTSLYELNDMDKGVTDLESCGFEAAPLQAFRLNQFNSGFIEQAPLFEKGGQVRPNRVIHASRPQQKSPMSLN